MAERNGEVPEHHRIVFRVGINLGDVIVEADDIHGDGECRGSRRRTGRTGRDLHIGDRSRPHR
jgi:class 3 adenylate cyclase